MESRIVPERRPTHAKRAHAKQMNAKRAHARRKPATPYQAHAPQSSSSPHGQTLVTRRGFLYGALGIGAVAALGGGGYALYNAAKPADPEEETATLQVAEDAVSLSDDCTAIPAEELYNHVSLGGSFELPYGTLVWTNNDTVAACLLPTEESARPLTQVALLYLGSGDRVTVLEEAVGQAEGYDIYDVRASEQGVVWTEANILDGIWRIYSASHSQGALGTPTLLDEGNANDWETPTIAAVGMYAFWQVLPALGGDYTSSDSLLKKSRFGSGGEAETAYSSTGRMSTAPYPTADGIVITPRTNPSTVNHQLTFIDAESGAIRDKVVLPTSMKPLEAGYGTNGFTFSFDAWYNFGGGIAKIGTYTPAQAHKTQDYDGLPWFSFTRNPSAAPAWCAKWFVVKSSRSVCGVDIASMSYFALPVESGSDKYGDYLATTGTTSTFVTYSNINNTAVDGTTKRLCLVRVWAPID